MSTPVRGRFRSRSPTVSAQVRLADVPCHRSGECRSIRPSSRQGDDVIGWQRLLRDSGTEDAEQRPRQHRHAAARMQVVESRSARCPSAIRQAASDKPAVREHVRRGKACQRAHTGRAQYRQRTPRRLLRPATSRSASQPHQRFDVEGLRERGRTGGFRRFRSDALRRSASVPPRMPFFAEPVSTARSRASVDGSHDR